MEGSKERQMEEAQGSGGRSRRKMMQWFQGKHGPEGVREAVI